MIRLAHFSDIHLETPAHWTWRDRLGKRLFSWLNLRLLGRGVRFKQAVRVLTALRLDLQERGYDRIVFSGDATALGFEEESALAAALLGLGEQVLPGLAVPGNHDYLTNRSATLGHFERHFKPWLSGERIDDALYPFAQRVGPIWLVGVNSATPNRIPIDARGRVGQAQLHRLEVLLRRLEGGPRILVTHYPVRVANGKPEGHYHGLRDLHELIDVARAGGISLWLHGHRHHAFHHDATAEVPFPVICAGSATQHDLWSYGDYTVEGTRLQAVIRIFDEASGQFVDGGTFAVEMRA